MFDRVPVAGAVPSGWLDLRWPAVARLELTFPPRGADGAALPLLPGRCPGATTSPSAVLDMAPGGQLAMYLEAGCGDLTRLTDAELLDAAIGYERSSAWSAAQQARVLAEFGRRRPAPDAGAPPTADGQGLSRFAADEVGLALRLSRGSAAIRLEQSTRLDSDLPDTLRAWEAGLLDHTKVRAILDATARLDPPAAAAVQARVLPRAEQQTAGKLRAALARAVIAADPGGANRRHERARRDRRVAVNPDTDGMATLAALLPAPDALSAYEWLTRLARGLGADDPRRMDARRADLLVALLTGRLTVAAPTATPTATPAATPTATPTATPAAAPAADRAGRPAATSAAGGSAVDSAAGGSGLAGPRQATSAQVSARVPMPAPVNPGKPLINVVVPFDTLAGRSEEPGELVGYGPVPADVARRVAADGVWKRLVTDPLSGALLDHGRTTYRPPAALADFVRARDLLCRHPTCRRRADDSELDHAVAYSADGETAAHNLYSCCGHHHRLKHTAPGWTVTPHPDASITWTTPTGHRYTSHPHDYRADPHLDDDLDHTRYVLERSRRRTGPAPPPAQTHADDPPPF